MVKKLKSSSMYGESPVIKEINSVHDKGDIITSIKDYFEKNNEIFLSNKYDIPLSLVHENQSRGMYAFVTQEFCSYLSTWIGGRKVLDPMAGRGWLAHGLRDQGVDVYATDNNSWKLSDHPGPKITEVEHLDAIVAVEKYASEIGVMIISWCPNGDKIDYKMIKKLHKLNPNVEVVYIGEAVDGATSSNKFFDNVEFLNDSSFEDVENSYHTPWGLNDFVQLVKFKPKKKSKGGDTNEKR